MGGERTEQSIPWNTVGVEDWAKGYAHVGRLMGVTHTAAWSAHRRLSITARPAVRPGRPVPSGLRPTDSPTEVAKEHGVSITTASKWLASVAVLGRPGTPATRMKRPSQTRCKGLSRLP